MIAPSRGAYRLTQTASPAVHGSVLAISVATAASDASTLAALKTATPGADFSGATLIGADLSGAVLDGVDLSGADLSGANLERTRLVGAVLKGAVLQGAVLEQAEFLGADLAGCNLGEVRASHAGFGKANLAGATCFGADFTGASFIDADLSHTDFRAAQLNQARLTNADLSHTSFERAYLQDADLEACLLSHSNFNEADLRRARLRNARRFAHARFIHTDIRDIDFSGAYLLRRQILDENYLHEFKDKNFVSNGIYWLWWLTSDCGRSLLRWSAWTGVVWLTFGVWYQHVAIDYGDHHTPLSPFYFSLVTLTTLGYGDVLPRSAHAQLVVMTEVVIGYMMLGGLLSIFAAKMGRRAD